MYFTLAHCAQQKLWFTFSEALLFVSSLLNEYVHDMDSLTTYLSYQGTNYTFFKCPQKDFDGLIICVKSPFKGWNIFLTNSMREKWKQNQHRETKRKVKKGIEGLKIFRKMQ